MKKLWSALGTGLAFIAMLSLLVTPALAMEEEGGYIHSGYHGVNSPTWSVNVWVEGWYGDDNLFYASNAGYNAGWGVIVNSFISSHTPTGVTATLEAQSWLGGHVLITVWIIPSNQSGSSVIVF